MILLRLSRFRFRLCRAFGILPHFECHYARTVNRTERHYQVSPIHGFFVKTANIIMAHDIAARFRELRRFAFFKRDFGNLSERRQHSVNAVEQFLNPRYINLTLFVFAGRAAATGAGRAVGSTGTIVVSVVSVTAEGCGINGGKAADCGVASFA